MRLVVQVQAVGDEFFKIDVERGAEAAAVSTAAAMMATTAGTSATVAFTARAAVSTAAFAARTTITTTTALALLRGLVATTTAFAALAFGALLALLLLPATALAAATAAPFFARLLLLLRGLRFTSGRRSLSGRRGGSLSGRRSFRHRCCCCRRFGFLLLPGILFEFVSHEILARLTQFWRCCGVSIRAHSTATRPAGRSFTCVALLPTMSVISAFCRRCTSRSLCSPNTRPKRRE